MSDWESSNEFEGVMLRPDDWYGDDDSLSFPDEPRWLVGGVPVALNDVGDVADRRYAGIDHDDGRPSRLVAAERKFHATGGLVGDWARRNGGDWS